MDEPIKKSTQHASPSANKVNHERSQYKNKSKKNAHEKNLQSKSLIMIEVIVNNL